jgi:hypothetical protein
VILAGLGVSEIHYLNQRFVARIIIALVIVVGALILAVVDRFTDAPIMRSRINKSSDAFLGEHGTIPQSAAASIRALENEVTGPGDIT